jgi:hypothetical protein
VSADAATAAVAGRAAAPAGVFSRRTAIIMVLVGALSFCAFIVLSAYAPDLRPEIDPRPHALSKSAVGFAGAAELLQARGAPVTIRRGRDDDFSDGLLVLTPEEHMSEALDPLLTSYTPTLVVLPKWNVLPDFSTPGWVQAAGYVPEEDVAETLPPRHGKLVVRRETDEKSHRVVAPEGSFRFGDPADSGPIVGFQTVESAELTPMLVDKQGRIVLGQIQDTAIYILSEPDLLNTQGLANPDTAWLGVRVIEALAGAKNPIRFDVTLFGFERTRNVLKLAFEPPFLSATLCALAAAVFMGLHAAARFGPDRRGRRAFALGKRALVDNSAALVRMTRREARMARGYVALTLASAAHAVGVRRGTDETGQRHMLDRLSEVARLPRTYSELARAAEAASDRESLLDAARALHAWRTEMTRERR